MEVGFTLMPRYALPEANAGEVTVDPLRLVLGTYGAERQANHQMLVYTGTVRRSRAVRLDRPGVADRFAPTFVDLFAGAGGLSLGLMQGGLRGLFAVEQEANAFETLRCNLFDNGPPFSFEWPDWLAVEPHEIGALIRNHSKELVGLRGTVDLLAGGPPCQGFSPAGSRRPADPRNRLFRMYIEMARLLEPTFVLFENVPGIAIEFGRTQRRRENPRKLGRPPVSYADRIIHALGELGYRVFVLNETASDFGVPQNRRRYLLFGVRLLDSEALGEQTFRDLLGVERLGLLTELGLPTERAVTVTEAISDLEAAGRVLVPCADSARFAQICYTGPRTSYQKFLHTPLDPLTAPNSLRLAKHRPDTVARFAKILATCRRGVSVSEAEREALGTGKNAITPLHPDRPSKTLTSLPDDLIHYSEPRILTVREYARLQSFPDWFDFRGTYTTGGTRRRFTVPRYTQVANAVPPLLGQALGRVVVRLQQAAGPRQQSDEIGDSVRRVAS